MVMDKHARLRDCAVDGSLMSLKIFALLAPFA